MSKKCVLIVEDEPWLAEAYAETLGIFSVVIAHSSADAIKETHTVQPDVVLLDMFLPGVNGLQLVHEFRSYDDLSDVPIVLMSSHSIPLTIEQRTAYGVVDVLKKGSLRPDYLLSSINKALKV